MDAYLFHRIIKQIKLGGCPPTVGYQITQDQYDEIERCLQENIKSTKSEVHKKQYQEYLKHWKLKLQQT